MTLDWMAWTWPTALFFIAIAATLITMTVLEIRCPTVARVGVLGLKTTRGDRLFISLLGSAFIHLAWLGLVGSPLWVASIISLVYAACVFRWA
ncbi:DUF2160 domain-containing protein [Rhodospirillum sp. A1_3_36]|uniref:DUF2160 domain-containing protein n=1 Tax=Rhodospirillum sp. A1_3_36 TaxID=3391666 RepID=UPI0039A6E457